MPTGLTQTSAIHNRSVSAQRTAADAELPPLECLSANEDDPEQSDYCLSVPIHQALRGHDRPE